MKKLFFYMMLGMHVMPLSIVGASHLAVSPDLVTVPTHKPKPRFNLAVRRVIAAAKKEKQPIDPDIEQMRARALSSPECRNRHVAVPLGRIPEAYSQNYRNLLAQDIRHAKKELHYNYVTRGFAHDEVVAGKVQVDRGALQLELNSEFDLYQSPFVSHQGFNKLERLPSTPASPKRAQPVTSRATLADTASMRTNIIEIIMQYVHPAYTRRYASNNAHLLQVSPKQTPLDQTRVLMEDDGQPFVLMPSRGVVIPAEVVFGNHPPRTDNHVFRVDQRGNIDIDNDNLVTERHNYKKDSRTGQPKVISKNSRDLGMDKPLMDELTNRMRLNDYYTLDRNNS